MPEPCPLFCPLHGETPFCGDNLVTYPSMCHVQAEICRGEGPSYVREGDCETVKTLIQKALNTGSPLSVGEWTNLTSPRVVLSICFLFLNRHTAYIDSRLVTAQHLCIFLDVTEKILMTKIDFLEISLI